VDSTPGQPGVQLQLADSKRQINVLKRKPILMLPDGQPG